MGENLSATDGFQGDQRDANLPRIVSTLARCVIRQGGLFFRAGTSREIRDVKERPLLPAMPSRQAQHHQSDRASVMVA
jgi:hypothetical protein